MMPDIDAEVLVIGSGPGGAAAAWQIAQQGHDVLLLDRASFPRDKTCGDGLPPMAVRTLRRIGVLDAVESAGAYRLDQMRVTGPFGMSYTSRFDAFMPPDMQYALVLPRYALDNLLLRHAVSAGVRFMPGVEVRRFERQGDSIKGVFTDSRCGQQMIRARYYLIATGANIGLLHREGFIRRKPRVVLAARAYYRDVQPASAAYDFYFDAELMPGYGWVFPVGDGRLNIGAGVYPTFWSTRQPARTLLAEFVERLRRRGILGSPLLEGAVRGYPLRVDYPAERAAGDNWMLVGEAAGLVNPVTGEGIDLALESGLLAACAILESGRRCSAHKAYQHALWERFGPLFNGLRTIRDTLANPVLMDYAIWLMRQHGFTSRTILRIAQGIEQPYHLFHPLVLLQFFIPVSPRFVCEHLCVRSAGYEHA